MKGRFEPETYEQMSNFSARLPTEGAFLRRVFAGGVKSALDCGCGPGHHAAMMADWGIEVLGIDASELMVRGARKQYADRPEMGFEVLTFSQIGRIKRPFDAVICMGNSLLLAGGKPQVAATLKRMARRLNPGGKLVLHLLNLHAMEPGRLHVRSTHRVETEGREWLFVKVIERDAEQAHMRILWADPTAEMPGRCASERTWPVLSRQWLRAALADAGFPKTRFHGDFKRAAYKAKSSPNMIVAAVKSGRRGDRERTCSP